MVCLKVVNILAKHQCPEIFAQELDDVECIVESWSVSRESVVV